MLDYCLNSPQIKEGCLLSQCIIHMEEKRKIKGVQTSVGVNQLFLSVLDRLCQFTHGKDLSQNIFQAYIPIEACYKTLAMILESELIP